MPTQMGSYDFKAAKQARDSIEVGGRNLALESKGEYNLTKSSDSAIMIGGRHPLSDYGKEICVAGTTVLVSFDAKVSEGTYPVRPYLTNSSAETQHSTPDICHATTDWQRFTREITLTGAVANWQVTSNTTTGSSGKTFYVRNMKVEIGTIATDWTPAPEDMAEATDSVEYIVGTQSASTGSWTGVTKDAALYTGKTIAYKLPYAGSGSASLNLTLAGGGTTGAKAVYSMTTRVTTHYPANSVIQMTYDGTYWRTTGWYDTNNYDRRRHNSYVIAAENITQYAICGGTSSGYKKLAGGMSFDLSYPIMYLNKATVSGQSYALASGTQSADFYEAINSINPANTATVDGVAINKMVYLKGTVSGTTFTCSATKFLTCNVPLTADGCFYIPLGIVANDATTKIYFSSSDKLYAYLDGYFQRVDLAAKAIADDASHVAVDYITDVSSDGIWVHPEGNGPTNGAATVNTYGWHISSAIELFRAGVSYIKMWVESSVAKLRLGRSDSGHVVLDSSGMEVLTDASTSVAEFGATGARIGQDNDFNVSMTPTNFRLYDPNDDLAMDVSSGTMSYDLAADTFTPSTSTFPCSLTLSHAPTSVVSLSWSYTYVSGYEYATSQDTSVVSGKTYYTYDGQTETYSTITPAGSENPNEEGWYERTTVYSINSDSLSDDAGITLPSWLTISGSTASVAVGVLDGNTGVLDTIEIGYVYNSSQARFSLAFGSGSTASSKDQAVFGRYNVVDDKNAFPLIVGCGTSSSDRKDTFRAGWDGSIQLISSAPYIKFTTKRTSSWTLPSGDECNSYITAYDQGDGYGNCMVIGSGGNTVIGSGESSTNIYKLLSSNSLTSVGTSVFNPQGEELFVASDYSAVFFTNCQDPAKREMSWINGSGNMLLKALGTNNAYNATLSASVTKGLFVVDQNSSKQIAGFAGKQLASGEKVGAIDVCGYNSSNAAVWNSLTVGVRKDGTRYYSVTDAAAFRSAIGAVSKAGDVLTGTVTLRDSTINRDGSNPSSQLWGPAFVVQDKDAERYVALMACRETDGRSRLGLSVWNEKTDGTEVTNALNIVVARDGTQTYSVSNPTNFRSAISAAAKTWTQVATTTGTTAKTFTSLSSSGYSEVLVFCYYSTTYAGSVIVPIAGITSSEREYYLTGGYSSGGGRRACCKLSLTKITPLQVAVDSSGYNGNWYVYAR